MSATDTKARATGTDARPDGGRWTIDPAHSSIEAVARHMMVSKVRGRFGSFSGVVTIDGDDPTRSQVEVSIDAKSIDTNDDKRDQHLRGEDFLHADEHPQLRFTSTSIDHVEGDRYRMSGDLTIRGVTHAVELDVDYLGTNVDPWGGDRALFEATTELDRDDWDMTWNQVLETGGILVSKKLDVELNIQLVKE